MGLDLPTNPNRSDRSDKSDQSDQKARDQALSASSDRLRTPFLQLDRKGLQSAADAPSPGAVVRAIVDQPVFFDAKVGWYQKDGNNQAVPFNAGGKPFYDEAKGEWVKPFDASPKGPAVTFDIPPTPGPGPSFEPPARPLENPRPPFRPEGYQPREQREAIPIHNKAEFDRLVLNAGGPVLVDFGATWCGPCRGMAPKVDQIARDFSGKAAVYKVDIDENSSWAGNYAGSYPTFTVFNRGQVTDQFVGAQNPQTLENSLAKQLQQSQSDWGLTSPQGYHPDNRFAPRPPQPGLRTLDRILPPELTRQGPLSRSGFHSEAERENFERFAASKGFTPQQIQRAESMSQQEWASFDAINAYRVGNRMQPLQFSPRVKLISDYQADRQAAGNVMTHGNPGQPYNPNHPYHLDRLKKVGLGFDGMHDGENAARDTRGGAEVTNMWLHSPGHLRPIKDPYLKIGSVSCSQSQSGRPFWTFNASTGQER